MWIDQTIDDAKALLLDASTVEKVTTYESNYVVVDSVPYTDELYLIALDELKGSAKLQLVKRTEERETFQPTSTSGS